MRRNIAIGTLGFMFLLGAAMISWGQEGDPQGPGPQQERHQLGGGGPHEWGEGARRFEGGGPGRWGEHRGPGMGAGEHGFGGGERLLHLAENPRVRQYLNLTDDQVARLHTIGVDAEKASVRSRADLGLRHIELRELLRADNPNHDAIMQKLDEVNALRGRMEKQRVETMLSARSVLTADQIQKIKTFREHRGQGFGERRHMMEHHGGPGGGPDGPAPKPQQSPAQ